MQKLEEVYKRLQKNKKRRGEISKMYKDELSQDARYQQITEDIKKLRDERASIENQIRAGLHEYKELEDLKLDIQTDQELLSDISLTMYANKEPVEIIDDYNNKWFPVFKVAFKKE